MKAKEIKGLALSLLRADSEEEVIALLRAGGFWDDPSKWRLYGDKEGNFAQAGNQQSLPEAALVEKVINSVDARLMCECQRRGIDPESDKAPTSIRDAVAMFFEDKRAQDDEAGSLANWAAARRTEESRFITIAATGGRPARGRSGVLRMCLTIADQGEGQSASRLPRTILSLNAKNKQRIRFVQGKFNMGGSGSLRFCGDQGLQLVISRRHPELRDDADPTGSDWAVTIVRREEPSNKTGEPIHSEFTYLAPVGSEGKPRKGEVLSFPSETLPLMPKGDEAYARDVQWGTAIKLYEYDTRVKQSNVILPDGLMYALERLLPEIALPVRIYECRGYGGAKERSFETPIAGLVVRLEEGRGGNLEPGFPLSAQLGAAGMNMKLRIYAFKEDRASTYLGNEGVIFSINGQSHGNLPKSVFARPKAVGLTRLKDSLLVLVDCSNLSARQREDLFMSSRDRLSEKPIRYRLEGEIEQLLRENGDLRQLQNRRRQEDIQSKLDEEKPLEEVLGKVLKASPSLKSLFLQGHRLARPFAGGGNGEGKQGGADGERDFVGRRHPTYFRFVNMEYGKCYSRNCEIGRRCRLTFETDVENGYFDRVSDHGTFGLEVIESSCEASEPDFNMSLESGRAHLNMALPTEVGEGDSLVVQVTVSDPTLSEPFINVAKLSVLAAQTRRGGKGHRRKAEGGGAGDKSSKSGIALPKVIPVKEGDERWHKYKFTPEDACHVISDPVLEGDEGKLEHIFYVNVSNSSLLTEMKYSKQDPRLMEAKFKYGNVLLGLAMLHHGNEDDEEEGQQSEDGEKEDATSRIRKVSAAVAPVLLPMIDQLSGLDEDDLAAFDEAG